MVVPLDVVDVAAVARAVVVEVCTPIFLTPQTVYIWTDMAGDKRRLDDLRVTCL